MQVTHGDLSSWVSVESSGLFHQNQPSLRFYQEITHKMDVMCHSAVFSTTAHQKHPPAALRPRWSPAFCGEWFEGLFLFIKPSQFEVLDFGFRKYFSIILRTNSSINARLLWKYLRDKPERSQLACFFLTAKSSWGAEPEALTRGSRVPVGGTTASTTCNTNPNSAFPALEESEFIYLQNNNVLGKLLPLFQPSSVFLNWITIITFIAFKCQVYSK